MPGQVQKALDELAVPHEIHPVNSIRMRCSQSLRLLQQNRSNSRNYPQNYSNKGGDQHGRAGQDQPED
jgi:hypothetical protein